MRHVVSLLALCAAAALPLAARADSISYQLTLTQQNGNIKPAGGTGMFTIVSSSSTPGTANYFAVNQNNKNPANLVSSLSFTIDGFNFDLSNAGNNTTEIEFSKDKLTQILYTGSEKSGKVSITLNGNGGLQYSFYDPATSASSNGVITASLIQATGVTPEPSALLLFGTGTLGFAGLVRRRLTA